MEIKFKHYKYTYRDVAHNPEALQNGGEPYATIRTWGYVPANPGSLEGVEEYASYWHLKWGSSKYQDITEIHQRELDKQLEISINETQSNE